MEPRKQEQTTQRRKEANEKKRRFQIVKLEERIAPSNASTRGNCLTNGSCYRTCTC